MYAYAVTTVDNSDTVNIEYCYGIYENEKKAFAVAQDLNDKFKQIQILKHSDEEDKKELEKLQAEYENLLTNKFTEKGTIGILYYHDDINLYWNVRQIYIVE